MSTSTLSSGRRLASAFVVALTAAGTMALLPAGAAQADTRPLVPSAATPVTVSADALPTVQINGVAWSQVVVGNTVYVAGKFTTARPAGAPAGTQEVARTNLLAYDIRTGTLIPSFAPSLDAQALVVTASPDGSRIYVGGDFTTVDGQTRKRVAAFDTASGTLITSWAPAVQSQVRAIAATDDTVYLGGSITAVGGVSRTRLAAVRASDGGLLPWAPVPGAAATSGSDQVMALVVTGGGSQVVAAGRFDSLNSVKATGVGALDATTGQTKPFAINQKLTNQGANSAVYSLSTDGPRVFGTAYDFSGPGNLEGNFVVTAEGGSILEINDCRGDSYSSYPSGDVLYVSSHAHDCGSIGGFPEQNPRVNKFGNAFTIKPTGTVGSRTIKNSNFRGLPAGSMLPWFPTMTPGTFTGQSQAGWSVTGNGQYVVFGGEFPRVNGVGQQGLVRYALPNAAPNKVGPVASDALTPTVTAVAAGTAKLAWTATSDQDNENLTYRVYRDGNTTTPVYEVVQASQWWKTPAMSFTDSGLSGGTHTYQVVAADPFGNQVGSQLVSVEVTGAVPTTPPATAGSYVDAVKADGATGHWRLGGTTGTTAADSVGTAAMSVGTGVTRGQAGALAGDTDTAFGFNGTANAALSTQTAAAAPNTFTQEAWFQTGSTTGGRILGFGNARTGTSTAFDRQVWLDAQGKVNFGVNSPFLFWTQKRVVTSTASFNDNKWHHVAATMGSSGMALYVDGQLVGSRTDTKTGESYSGYLRVGSDKAMGGVDTFNGRIDEVALYRTVLSAQQVAAHNSLGRTGKPANVAPAARFGAVADDLEVAFDGSASTDPDGTVSAWAWTFGDGTTGSGRTVSHTFPAAGTYAVSLVVTDDRGATATLTQQVTVVANQAPTAVFGSQVADRLVALDASASSDTDGRVASYAWNFGDGSTGTGATTSHTYAADGTYRVTLTVTDDDGATAVSTADLAVSAPVVLAADAFDRTVTGGLGTADVGGAWTTANGTTRLSVAPGTATMALAAPGNLTGAYLGAVSQTSADLRTTVSLSAAPTGTGTAVYVTGRRVGANLEYRARLRFLPNGTVGVMMSRLAGSSTETAIGSEVIVPGLTYTPGQQLEVRVRAWGTGTTQLTASVWAAGATEPGTPTVSRSDATPELQAAGGVGLSAYLFGSATAPLDVRFTGFSVTQVR
ncbi:radical SAM protein [Blastococcus sp. TF02-8]|uniref:PKD domain-containing protein n=1 Tax=Blastococcus sp. TF02-8 TaxID=2250574 RepID=UPI000DE9E02C|nr:PKD domain-containing protein [Blastococcus sp. TF02-8]RBY95121.1 radical SAM protein [Blastococcus sp. TF02-8]